MAIQIRRGPYSEFDPTKLQPGELAAVTSGDPSTLDGRAIYICYAAGVVKRLSTIEDLYHDVASIEGEIVEDLTEIVQVAAQSARDAAAGISRYDTRITYLERLVFGISETNARVAELEAENAEIRDTLDVLARKIAHTISSWVLSLGVLYAPTAAAASISSNVLTVAGAVSSGTLILTD